MKKPVTKNSEAKTMASTKKKMGKSMPVKKPSMKMGGTKKAC